MARVVDQGKLEAVKKALIELIIKEGTSNASMSKVARLSRVSIGYLYRHYDSKTTLINELYLEEFKLFSQVLVEKIQQQNKLEGVISAFYTDVLGKVENQESHVLFVLKMMTDYSIEITDEMRSKLIDVISLLRNKFKNEISNTIKSEQLYIQILGSILMFVNIRKRGVLNQDSFTEDDIQTLTSMTVKALA